MNFKSESHIRHPVDRVYQVYRDRLPELPPYMADIKAINVLSREDVPGGVKLLNEWVLRSDNVPKVAQGVVKPEMLKWFDHAEWHDAEAYVGWRLELPAFGEQVKCTGRNTFLDDGKGGTRVVLTGELDINVTRIPGVPSFMLKRLTPKVVEFVVKLITPNLEKVNTSIGLFLDDHK